MTKEARPGSRQAELDALARRRGWRGGPYRSWTCGGYTMAVSAREGFSIVERSTARVREVRTLEDLDRTLQWARATGGFPAETA